MHTPALNSTLPRRLRARQNAEGTRLTAPAARSAAIIRHLARRSARMLCVLAAPALLAGCNMVVLDPSGDIAVQQRNLIIASTALMLLVIVPVIAMTFIFAWRYRASNPDPDATYDPDFHHSTQLEVVIWTVPLLIIIALGAMTWISTHTLDPFRPLGRLAPGKPVPADMKPLKVQVVSLDWKWLFIYPDLGIASVNEMAVPVDQSISFDLTSSSVWNTFYVPALAGMVYTMPAMRTQLQAVINKEGTYRGRSAHYSGSGFSRMEFDFRGLSRDDFDKWVAKAKASGTPLDRDTYQRLEKPSEAEPVRVFGSVDGDLFDSILGLCVRPGQMCMQEMQHIDRKGGAGKEGHANRDRLDYDNRRLESGTEPSGATFPASGRTPRSETVPQGATPRGEGTSGQVNEQKTQPDQGQGNALPGADRGPAPAQLNNRPAEPHKH